MPDLRERQVEETRGALLAVGREMFGERAAVDISAEQVSAAAGLTRGALYHHSGGKRGLFEAVFREQDERAAQIVRSAIDSGLDPLDRAERGAAAFLDLCTDRADRHVVLQQGPLVLGWARWRELDGLYLGGIVLDAVIELIGDSGPPTLVAAALYGALTELSLAVSTADDPGTARQTAADVVQRLLVGLDARSSGAQS